MTTPEADAFLATLESVRSALSPEHLTRLQTVLAGC